MEASFIRIPLEEAKREAKALHRQIERDLFLLQSFFSTPKDSPLLCKGIDSGCKRLATLHTHITDSIRLILAFLTSLQQRIAFLQQLEDGKGEELQECCILRLIGDHLQRSGHCSTAALLIDLHPELAPLLDSHLFARIRAIEQAMLEKHSLVEALTWATENKAFLKRIGSKLEFALRTQEYIEIARGRNYFECLKYAKGTLSAFIEAESMDELMPVAGLLAIAPDTLLEKYRDFYADSRWKMLAEMFRADFYALYGLPKESPLLLNLQAGLAVLKTPSCNERSSFALERSCPVCSGPFAGISGALPISHRNNSRIVCQVTGSAIDENNPPIIFPNGHVYSAMGVAKVAGSAGAQGKFVCPRTGKVFRVEEGRKCFLTS